jgi:D-inositol-3-phosphate glycosyltransferase
VSGRARRLRQRQRRHASRWWAALRRVGPGRFPGAVVAVTADDREITISGWTTVGGAEAGATVLVRVGGTPVGAATPGAPTPLDDAGRPRSPRPDVGWHLVLPRAALRPGTVEVTAVVITEDDLAEELAPLATHLPAVEPPRHAVEQPVDAERLEPPLARVRGWLLPEPGDDRVEVRIDGAPAVRARLLADPRPDVAERFVDVAAPVAGWEADVALPTAQGDRPAVVEVAIVGEAGPRVTERLEVVLGPAPPAPPVDHERLATLRQRGAERAAPHRPAPQGLHLLVVTHSLGLGGGQLYLQLLLEQLLDRPDLTCTVLSMHDGALRQRLEDRGVVVHVTGALPVDGLAYEARLLELLALVVEPTGGANVVLANTAGTFWGVDLAARLGLPSVWAIHESFPIEQVLEATTGPGVDATLHERFAAALQGAAALVFEADATRALFEPAARPGRCVRIDYGVDLEAIDAARGGRDRTAVRAGLGVGDDDVLLVCIGTIEPRKAQGTLVVAFGEVARTHPEARLVLVGDMGTAYAAAVHHAVHRLELGDRLRVLSGTLEITDWYLAADGFVLGSDVESLPRSMLEAMAFETPVIGSAVFGVPEIVLDGVNGVLFEPRSLRAATAALARFLDLDPLERAAMGARARADVEATRGAGRYARAYGALLDALVADPDRPPGEVLGQAG